MNNLPKLIVDNNRLCALILDGGARRRVQTPFRVGCEDDARDWARRKFGDRVCVEPTLMGWRRTENGGVRLLRDVLRAQLICSTVPLSMLPPRRVQHQVVTYALVGIEWLTEDTYQWVVKVGRTRALHRRVARIQDEETIALHIRGFAEGDIEQTTHVELLEHHTKRWRAHSKEFFVLNDSALRELHARGIIWNM